MSRTDRRPLVTHHTIESPDPCVDLMPSIQDRPGWYVHAYGSCPRILRVFLHGPYTTRAGAKRAARRIEARS
jgi:hypothetical protein